MSAPFVKIVAADGQAYPITAAKSAPANRGNGAAEGFSPVPPVAPTPSPRIARVSGEAFDCDQIGWSCDECGRDEYGCECEAETCGKCNRAFDAYGYCGCKGTNVPSLEEVQEQIARVFNPSGWQLAEQSAVRISFGMGGTK